MSESCPKCDSETGLREILYGLPAEPVDESKYVIGGCCISENDPTLACKNCGWEGEFINNLCERDLGPNLTRKTN